MNIFDPEIKSQVGNVKLLTPLQNPPAKSKGHALGSGYSYLDRMFLMVVNKGNRLVGLLDAIHGHTPLPTSGERLQNGDVVDRLPISVVHLERLPIRWEARGKTQFDHLQPQP